MEAQERSVKENIAQLKEKLRREKENLIREQNMILDHKLKVSLAVASVVLDGHCPGTSGGVGEGYSKTMEGSSVVIYSLCFIKTLSFFTSPPLLPPPSSFNGSL